MANLIKILPRIFFHGGDPLQMVFFITSKCNLRCDHCFYKQNLNASGNELSLDEIKKISASMGYLMWLSLTGGEPFLRDDIGEIAGIFYKNNRVDFLNINTNGYRPGLVIGPAADICRTAGKAGIKVYVSLDGLEDTHNRMRGAPDSFKKALETIRELKALKREFKNLGVATITTCTADNQNELKRLAVFLRDEVRPDRIELNLLRGLPRSSPLATVDLKNYFDFIRIKRGGWAGIAEKRELFQEKMLADIFKNNECLLPCLAGSISCVLSEEGDLYPCELLDRKIGNLRETGCDFKKLWRSKKAGEIRKFIRDSRCFCTYECAMATNILFNPVQLLKLALSR